MKVFLLGVGAQKSGTTWLHDYLAASPEADFGFAKEYHIFDSLTLPQCANFRKRIARIAIKELKGPAESWMVHGRVRRAAFLADPEMYFDYFAGLLRQDGIRLTGDITPTYAGLSEETFRRIRDGFATRGIAVRPVFLMRDPVDRLQSMVRMSFRDRKVSPSYDQEIRMMRRRQTTPGEQLRSDYAHTIRALDSVFGTEVFYEFYERLFSDASIRRLCDHLGIAWRAADFSIRKNVSRTENDLTPDDRQKFAHRYRRVYGFCGQRFGPGMIEMAWQPPEPETARDRAVGREAPEGKAAKERAAPAVTPAEAAADSGHNRSSAT